MPSAPVQYQTMPSRRATEIYFARITLPLLLAIAGFTARPLFSQEHAGLDLFRKAYALEKSDPDQAIRLYRASIASGLERKLSTAARWKLFYLYKKTKDFSNALSLLNSFGSGSQIEGVREDLYSDIRYKFDISKEAAVEYARGVLLLGSKSPSDSVEHFKNAIRLNPFSSGLKRDIVSMLNLAGLASEAMRLMRESSGNPVDASLQEADLLVKHEKYSEAKRILESVSASDGVLDDDVKGRILYLFGRVERDQGNIPGAVSYFRLAARYANGETLSRQLSLAAYGLMQLGYDTQAFALVKKIPDSSDGSVHLIRLILHCSPGGDTAACGKLREYRSGFKRDTSFLAKRALRILDELPTGGK